MADARDDRISSAYRDMPGEGPPPALDAAIQAAARRAVGAKPRPARHWPIPVSIAAVLALAVGISLQVEREKPVVVDGTPVPAGSAEYPVPQAATEKEEPAARAPAAPAVTEKKVAPAPPPAKRSAPAVAPEPKPFVPEPPAMRAPAPAALSAPAPAAMPAAPPPDVAPPPQASGRIQPSAAAGATVATEAARAAPLRAKSELARDATVQEQAMSQALETPERRLERIADLRAKGLHDEADRELAQFRRAFPAYRLTEEWRRKVERP